MKIESGLAKDLACGRGRWINTAVTMDCVMLRRQRGLSVITMAFLFAKLSLTTESKTVNTGHVDVVEPEPFSEKVPENW